MTSNLRHTNLIMAYGAALLLGIWPQVLAFHAYAVERHKAECPFVGGRGSLFFVDNLGQAEYIHPDNADSAEKFTLWTEFTELAVATWGEPRLLMMCYPVRKKNETIKDWSLRGVPIVIPAEATSCRETDFDSNDNRVYCD